MKHFAISKVQNLKRSKQTKQKTKHQNGENKSSGQELTNKNQYSQIAIKDTKITKVKLHNISFSYDKKKNVKVGRKSSTDKKKAENKNS